MNRFLLSAILSAYTGLVSADPLVQVVVSHASTGTDAAGAIFSAVVQKTLVATHRYTTVSEKSGAAFVMSIQTMGLDGITRAMGAGVPNVSMYSVLLLLRLEDGTSMYVDNWAGYCGDEKAIEMGSDVGKRAAAELDKIVDAIKEAPTQPAKPALPKS